ncbi:hypothetical protein Q8A73_010451 [Channa argus]|nr:hypothetical protein Q8A73_010451 [Channa argus]
MDRAINLQDPEFYQGRRTSANQAENGRKPAVSMLQGQPDFQPSSAHFMVDESGPRPPSTNPHAELPVLPTVSPSSQPSTALVQHNNGPLKIHNHSVEEYQDIYHEVEDDMVKYNSGRVCPYSPDLRDRVKYRLCERLNRPHGNTPGHLYVDLHIRIYKLNDSERQTNTDVKGWISESSQCNR